MQRAVVPQDLAHGAFDSVANSYVSSISVFECKCAIVRSLGVNIPVREIGTILAERCGWEQDGKGVSFEQFKMLLNMVKNCMEANVFGENHYAHFDTKNKGWINERDVYLAFASVAPKLADRHAHGLFALADVHSVGQITHRHYSTTVSELKKKGHSTT